MGKKAQIFFRRTHKRARKKAKFLLRHPLLVPVTTFFVVVFFGMGMFVTVGATTGGAKDTRIVKVFNDGENQTHTTRAKTVGDLLDRLGIVTIPEDIIEPGRNSVILEDNTQINIYRARPVELIDGDRSITVLSAQRTPRLIAKDAGVILLPEDDIEFNTRESTILASSASEQLIINRSVGVELTVYGILKKIRTTSPTIEEFLRKENIALKYNETVQPENLQTPIQAGMLISVNRPGVKTLALRETIPYSSEIRTDPELLVGQTKLLNAGVDGERAVIYEIEEVDGIEIARREIQIVITRDPVTEVRVRGAKPATLSSSVSVSDDKIALMAAAGIAPSDYAYVDFIISKESRWRPGALNASSGAYGLCQSLPASKMASAGDDYLTNPVTQLRWCNSYAARYGGWQGSYNAWLAQSWW
jgi:resuscitation-promoting factor RpfB